MDKSKRRILLVEDDEVDVMNVRRAFKKNNIPNPLTVVENGLKALELLRTTAREEAPSIILLDINMPKMNGIEFLKELRADPDLKRIPVFVMTTSNEDKDRIEAYNMNIAGYIIKPVSFEQFTDSVATLSQYWNLIEFPR